jgi:hypothetical protein
MERIRGKNEEETHPLRCRWLIGWTASDIAMCEEGLICFLECNIKKTHMGLRYLRPDIRKTW